MRWVLLCMAVGCGGPQTANVRWTYVENPAPIDSVVVFESIQHEARVGILFRGFETRMQSQLAACGVKTTILHGLPEGDATRLSVRPDGGTYTKVSAANDEDVTTRIDGAFKLELFDQRARKVTWRGIVDVKTDSTPDVADGEAFADTVLSRLRSDGVVACHH
ncbi:MAG TPA: hypothetical protein VFQ65_23630 [Kofleriaceae bacterium]|nr:hypothetical protein [Kofleriaceae bacterium]